MRKKTAQCLTLLVLLACCSFLKAQTEVNVKVRKDARATQLQFQSLSQASPSTFPAFRTQDPTFSGLTRVQSMSPAGRETSSIKTQLFTLSFSQSDVQTQVDALMATGLYEWVEPNRVHALHTAPNDPNIDDQYYQERIGTFEAWDITRGNSNVVIGILDTGLDYDHPEFDGQIAINTAEDLNGNGTFEPWASTVSIGGISGDFDGIDADGNGFVDDVIGYDFTDQPRSPFGGDYLTQDPDPLDDNTHGTLVAGIVGAKENNNLGGAGIAPGCRLMVLRAFSANGSGEDDDIARAIIYAADNGVSVLNFSFGDIYPSRIMHEAIQYAYAKGVVMVGSSGNGTGDEIHYPSGFNEVISVAATAVTTQGTDYLWPLSSFGVTVDLAAPGSGIFTTQLRDTTGELFGTFSGTSTSAPMVSAAAALLISQRGNCSPEQIRGILTSSADDVNPIGWDHFTGAGRLNILTALNTVGASNIKIISPVNDGGTASDSVWIVGTVLHPEFAEWQLFWVEGLDGNSNWNNLNTGTGGIHLIQQLNDTLAVWDVSGLAEGEYTLRLRVNLTNGDAVEDRIRFIIDRTPPQIEIKVSAPIWDNDIQKQFLVFRSSDQGTHVLNFRQGTNPWRKLTADRQTRNGEFLLGPETIQAGNWEYFIESTNSAGLSANSPVQSFMYSPKTLNTDGFVRTGAEIPMGSYLSDPVDMDGDGLLEMVMSEYNDNLGFGALSIHEYNGGLFSKVHTVQQRPILIPKDVQDTDGNGLYELLCSVNDSLYVIEQPASTLFPTNTIYSNLGNSLYAARWGDTDNDGQLEMLAKDFKDYYVLEKSGSGYQVSATLADITPGYAGSIAPRVLISDNNRNNRNEIIFGDFDGDVLAYEFDGTDYQVVFQDSTLLEKGGAYLTPVEIGGYRGFFSAVHSSSLRNADFEYDPGYWMIRLMGMDSGTTNYTVSDPIYLYDIDTDGYNAATVADVDGDGDDEVIFSTFPRTYIFDFNWPDQVSWFHYGDLCTDHVAGDFDGNGKIEFALGRGDKALFYEISDDLVQGDAPAFLEGKVVGPAQNILDWTPNSIVPNAYFRIWRGDATNLSQVQITLLDSTGIGVSTYVDNTVSTGTPYLYVVQQKITGAANAGTFSNFVILTPHALGRVDSAIALSETQVELFFNTAVPAEQEALSRILLDGTDFPVSIIPSGNPALSLIVSFDQPFSAGNHVLSVDSTFLDAQFAPLNPAARTANFTWNPTNEDFVFLTGWNAENEKEAILRFNYPMDFDVLNRAHYTVKPYGTIESIVREGTDQNAIRITFRDVVLGAVGYPVSVIVTGVKSTNGTPINDKEGNVATFISTAADLSGIYVYPNPVSPNELFEGLRFANLPKEADIRIISVSGMFVNDLQERDGDGGFQWDMRDSGGNLIKPGKYIYYVNTPDGQEFIGKFTLLDQSK